jgi:hypothetical protein
MATTRLMSPMMRLATKVMRAQLQARQQDTRALPPIWGNYVAKNAFSRQKSAATKLPSLPTHARWQISPSWQTWRTLQNGRPQQQIAKFARCSTSAREHLEHLGPLEESRRSTPTAHCPPACDIRNTFPEIPKGRNSASWSLGLLGPLRREDKAPAEPRPTSSPQRLSRSFALPVPPPPWCLCAFVVCHSFPPDSPRKTQRFATCQGSLRSAKIVDSRSEPGPQ